MTTPHSSHGEKPEQPSTQDTSGWSRWLVGGVLVLAVVIFARQLPLAAGLNREFHGFAELGVWGPVLFVVFYVVATVLMLPASVLTFGAGAVFGVMWGSVYVSIGATLGATVSFLVGRHLARSAVARKIEGNERFAAIDKAVANEGWKIVCLTRLSPVFPFTLLNYAFGLTQVRLRHYVLASWIGMMPGTVTYVYLGSLAKVATGERTRVTGEWILYGVGLFATIIVTVFVTRLARRSLAHSLQD